MDTMRFNGQVLELLDQSILPLQIEYIQCETLNEVAEAIKSMKVRGAPAIGATAAFGLAIAANNFAGDDLDSYIYDAGITLKQTRPTAVNLFWAVDRMLAKYESIKQMDIPVIQKALVEEAQAIFDEDIASNKTMGMLGAELLPETGNVLTHCNAGALATAGYGTALGVIRAAHELGKTLHVYADETRPLLQGARLTAFELMQDNIPVTLITDNMAAYLMAQRRISAVIVGADRIAANGDVANKIGTYGLAVLAHHHQLPFYVAAPWSTIDLSIDSGAEIPIEERHESEVKSLYGMNVAPHNVAVYNPAFDVTPHGLVTAIITERGIIRYPFNENLKRKSHQKVVC